MRPRAALTSIATLAALQLGLPRPGAAQPVDPFEERAPLAEPVVPVPDERTLPPPAEPVLAEQIAAALVTRAQELYDARVFVEAKQLAVEALVTSPRGAAAEHAKYLISRVNERLGITDAPPAPPVEILPPAGPGTPPPPVAAPARRLDRDARTTLAARVHGGLVGGVLGATLGAVLTEDTPAAAGIPLGVVGGALAALLLPGVVARHGFTEAQVRTAGMSSVWGGVVGGLLADAVDVDGTTARGVLIGTSVGATLGALAGVGLASSDRLTRGDVALIDTLAGVGAAAGLTLGMVMQPVESEGYSVNAMLGAVGGVVVGYVAAPQTRTTTRRMVRVAAYAAVGGGLPFLVYPMISNSSTSADEQAIGAISTIGLVGGLVLGFQRTRGLDRELDVPPGAASPATAPPALVGRSAAGQWAPGTLAIQPLSRALAPQAGMVVPVLGGAF